MRQGSLGDSLLRSRRGGLRGTGIEMAGDGDDKRWDCPPHTKAKHQMLGKYLDAWFPIIASWNGRMVFLDGFAGRGRYTDGSEGSPLIALRHLLDHRYYPSMAHREFVFLFVEANKGNAERLQQEIDAFKASRKPWPKKVKVEVIHGKFDQTAAGIIDHLKTQKANLAPTFAFVDPFGYSGLPLELLGELLAYPRTEVFVNFMVGHVQRFIERDGQENAMRGLFGIDVADILEDWDEDNVDRVDHLRAVYESQLQKIVGFEHVQSFGMINETGNIGYYLVHGTRHRSGVKAMKAAMWSVDPGGGFMFSDRMDGVDVLFEKTPQLGPLRTAMLAHFAGKKRVPVEDIEWFSILETPYRETHIRKILTSLENEGLIDVARTGIRGFPNGKTHIDFL
jgi:three-Cys-motif partner protein